MGGQKKDLGSTFTALGLRLLLALLDHLSFLID